MYYNNTISTFNLKLFPDSSKSVVYRVAQGDWVKLEFLFYFSPVLLLFGNKNLGFGFGLPFNFIFKDERLELHYYCSHCNILLSSHEAQEPRTSLQPPRLNTALWEGNVERERKKRKDKRENFLRSRAEY